MDKPHTWMLEDQRTDGAYIIPRKPTTAECTGLDFEAELRAHKRVVERLYKRNTADVRAQKRAQVQHVAHPPGCHRKPRRAWLEPANSGGRYRLGD